MYVCNSYSFLPKSGGAFNHMTSGLMTTIMQEGSLDALVQETRVLNQVTKYMKYFSVIIKYINLNQTCAFLCLHITAILET